MKHYLRSMLTLLVLFVVGGVNSWADTYTWTMAQGDIDKPSSTSFTVTAGTPSITWSFANASTSQFQWDGNNDGYRFGSRKSPVTNMTLTTTGISGIVTSVKVNMLKSGSNATGTINGVTVGETSFSFNSSSTATLTTSAKDYEFTGSATGTIVIDVSGAVVITSITITYTTDAVSAPSISPTTDTYSTEQTVTITNNHEGATVYYTTDGSEPSAENGTALTSTAKGATATFTVSKTTTVKAIAVATVDGETVSSSVATSVITIQHNVTPPQITYDETTHKVTITAEDGLIIYYTTGGVDVVSGGKLSGSEVYYTGEFTISKATTIKAVAVDADGNISSVTTQVCTYNGEVTLPYYEEFHDDLGNFTTTNTSTSTSYSAPEWELLDRSDSASISFYGEARKFAFVAGYINNDKEIRVGEAKMTSPIIDLTTADGEQAYTSVTLDFSHAGFRFSNVTSARAKCRLYVCEVGSTDSTLLTIPNWFTINYQYPRQNSGDIDLSSYIGKKIRITFKFSNYSTSSSSAGVWNIIKFNVVGVKPGQDRQHESVSLSDNGFFTYVTQNPIDWKSTLDANSTTDGNNINIHGYKVTQFNKTKAVLVEFGKNTANTNSEDITPAGTPIVLQGTVGENKLIVSNNSNDQIPSVKGNLLHAAAEGGTKPSATQSLYALKKKKNQDATDDMGHYIWRKLKTTQAVPYGKAYLNGAQMTDGEITTTTNAAKGIFTSFEDIQESQGTTTGIVEVPTAEHKTTDGYFYNLQGMRVAHPAHGIYIYNGRKIIIK